METTYNELIKILESIDYKSLKKNPKKNYSKYQFTKDELRIEKLHYILITLKEHLDKTVFKLVEPELYYLVFGNDRRYYCVEKEN